MAEHSRDATGEFVLAFVFLVAFAWMCAGLALSLLEREADRTEAVVAPS